MHCLLPYLPLHVTLGALVAHRHSFTPPRCRTSKYRRSFVPLSVSLWNDLSDPVFDGVGLVGFKSRANALVLALLWENYFIYMWTEHKLARQNFKDVQLSLAGEAS